MKYALNTLGVGKLSYQFCAAIARAIINQNDLGRDGRILYALNDLGQGGGLVVDRNNDADDHR